MTDIQYTLSIRRGNEPMKLTANPTTENPIVQAPWLVSSFISTENVKRWLAMRNIRNTNWPTLRSSCANRPRNIPPASLILWTCGYRSLTFPMILPVYQDTPDMNTRMTMALDRYMSRRPMFEVSFVDVRNDAQSCNRRWQRQNTQRDVLRSHH